MMLNIQEWKGSDHRAGWKYYVAHVNRVNDTLEWTEVSRYSFCYQVYKISMVGISPAGFRIVTPGCGAFGLKLKSAELHDSITRSIPFFY